MNKFLVSFGQRFALVQRSQRYLIENRISFIEEILNSRIFEKKWLHCQYFLTKPALLALLACFFLLLFSLQLNSATLPISQSGEPIKGTGTVSQTYQEPTADLSLTKTVTNTTLKVGEQVSFITTVYNEGPSSTTGIQVADQLLSGLTYVGDDSGGQYDAATGIWTIGALESGGSIILTITAILNQEGEFISTAQITASDLPDPDSLPGNDAEGEDDQVSVELSMRHD